jgi:lysine 6-dehydrogenase
MERYAVVGAGLMGRVIAKELLDIDNDTSVSLYDFSSTTLEEAATFIASERLNAKVVDISDPVNAVEALKGHVVVIGALPHSLSHPAILAAIDARVSFIDLVGEAPEKRIALHDQAVEAGCLIVPGMGVAPGISNICVGQGIEWLDETRNVYIYVGGIPVRKEPPLFYQTVYLLESVFNAYLRPATIIEGGKSVIVEPLSGLEEVSIPEPIGVLEGFFTDGLASLPLTVGGDIENTLFEKTLRYPGHVACMKALKDCGLLQDRPIEVNGVKISPRDVLIELLGEKLQLGPEGDILVMRVIVEGIKDGKPRKHTFELIDYFNVETGYTAMARTTGFPAVITARMIASDELTEKGVFFPEQLLTGDRFRIMIERLAQKGVEIQHQVED